MKILRCWALNPGFRIVMGSVLLYAAVLWWFPFAALALSQLVFAGTLALCLGRLACVFAATRPLGRCQEGKQEFVSIHIATYSEPPQVVIDTLNSLAAIEGDNYEVIVLDNNTKDSSLYSPVREHCRRLGSRFHFFHFDGVLGAKAGALNISLKLASPKTTKILVLDADYQARPDILTRGLSYFVDSQVALVQFPQAYRNSRSNCGLSWEYRLFFDVYMNLANRWNTVLSTGTAAFLCKHALLKSGGWSGQTLTEDAELGLRLHRHGYRAVYVPEVVAAGLMPTDLKSLKVQRRRWVLGNAQSLGSVFKESGISWKRKGLMLLQLTAWANPLLLSLTGLLTATVLARFGSAPEALAVATVAASSVVVYLSTTLLYFVAAVVYHGGSSYDGLRAFMAHIGMFWEATVCPYELFLSQDKKFVRTDKFLRSHKSAALLVSLMVSLLFGSLGFKVFLSSGCPRCAFMLSLFALLFSSKAYLQWNLCNVHQYTVTLSQTKPLKACAGLGQARPLGTSNRLSKTSSPPTLKQQPIVVYPKAIVSEVPVSVLI